MEVNAIKDFYAQSLGVKAPWSVTEVKILGDSRRIEVRVECREGTVWTDPETRQQAHVHGWRERRWRHLDTCEYETVVIANPLSPPWIPPISVIHGLSAKSKFLAASQPAPNLSPSTKVLPGSPKKSRSATAALWSSTTPESQVH